MTISHYDDYNGKHSSLSEASPAQAKEVGAIATSFQRQENGVSSYGTSPHHTASERGLRVHIRADWGHSLPLYSRLPSSRLGPPQELEHWEPEAGTQGRKRSQSPTRVQEGLASSWASPQPPLTANTKTRGSKTALKRRKVILRLA